MRHLILTIGLVLLFSVFAMAQSEEHQSEGSKIIENMKFDEIKLNIPEVGKEVERIELDNGIIVYMYEDHRLPMFNINSVIRCGSIYEPLDKSGLSNIVGTVMRNGGTTNISGDSLNKILEYKGASLETRIGEESGSASLSILSKDLELGVQLYADLLRNPAFPEDKIEQAKEEIKNNIKRRNDDPGSITSRYFYNILYGDHPYGRILEWETVKNITRDDLIAYHKEFFVPEHLMIGVSGDFNKDEIIKLLKKYLGDWKKSGQPLPEMPAVADNYKPGVYEIFKDINQANIRLGHLGIKRDNPDKYAINLMNFILGGGSFTSRMTSKVRSDEGLAYSVGTRFDTGSRDYGTFYAYCQTKSATTFKAIDLMVKEIERIREGGVTEKELEDAKNSTINRFIFNFDNSSEIVGRLMGLEYDHYPADYYKHYIDNYKKVTLDDIKRVANEYLNPDKIAFIVVGNPETYEKPLDAFGPVTKIELEEPNLQ